MWDFLTRIILSSLCPKLILITNLLNFMWFSMKLKLGFIPNLYCLKIMSLQVIEYWIAWLFSCIYARNAIFQIFESEFKYDIEILDLIILMVLKYFQEAYWVGCFSMILNVYIWVLNWDSYPLSLFTRFWVFESCWR